MMNVFEDLIEELKEDHLLEETIVEFPESISGHQANPGAADHVFQKGNPTKGRVENSGGQNTVHNAGDPKKFASDEISSLQMVEHVLSGVERDILNVEASSFDDLEAKQALHRFVHSSAEPGSDDSLDLESKLEAEIKSWKESLLARDAKMSLANIRNYCETSQPPLSSQALFALARFYFSTGPRAAAAPKMDFVLTRLFSKRDEGERRMALVNKEETITHLRKRFADWAGKSPEDADEVSESMLSVMSFEDFSIEAENVETIDDLLKGDFFNRLIVFKESIRAELKSPEVMAACIRCNIASGNAVVESLERFGQKTNPARLKKKFATIDNDIVAHAIGRTIDLDQLLDTSSSKPAPAKERPAPAEIKKQSHSSNPVKKKQPTRLTSSGIFAVNKTLLLASTVLITLSIGLYVWTNYFGSDQQVSASVPAVELNGFENRDMVKTAKISGEMMYAQMTPAWDGLADDKKQELVQKLYTFASKKGVQKLNVLDTHGATVAFATPGHQELTER